MNMRTISRRALADAPRILAAVALGLVAGRALSASSGPGVGRQQVPTFRSTTALVLVDVTVVDRGGRPVSGLGADDFQVKLNGVVRPVKALTYEEAKGALPVAPSDAAAPHRETTNAAGAGGPRVFVVLVDDLSIPPSRGKSLFHSAGQFVARLPATDAVGFTTSSKSVTVNPTFDHAAIAAALDRVVGDLVDPTQLPGPQVGLQEALNIAASDSATLNFVVSRDCFNGRSPTQSELASEPLRRAGGAEGPEHRQPRAKHYRAPAAGLPRRHQRDARRAGA